MVIFRLTFDLTTHDLTKTDFINIITRFYVSNGRNTPCRESTTGPETIHNYTETDLMNIITTFYVYNGRNTPCREFTTGPTFIDVTLLNHKNVTKGNYLNCCIFFAEKTYEREIFRARNLTFLIMSSNCGVANLDTNDWKSVNAITQNVFPRVANVNQAFSCQRRCSNSLWKVASILYRATWQF